MAEKKQNDDHTSTQNERFKRTAREHGVELDERKLAETLRRMAKREKPTDAQERPTKGKSGPSGD